MGLGWAICRSGKLVGARGFGWGVLRCGVVEGAGLVVSGNLDRVVVVERKEEERKKEQFLKLVARDLWERHVSLSHLISFRLILSHAIPT